MCIRDSPYSLAFNLFLHNSPLQANSYCEEEMKMVNETRKIMGLPHLRFTATCVRVPVLRAHSEAVNICLLYTSPSPRDATLSRMPSSDCIGHPL